MNGLSAAKPPQHPDPGGTEHRLAMDYAPILMMDRLEPFRPVVVGYDVFVESRASRSFPRHVHVSSDEGGEDVRPSTTVIEYAFWWDWDIEHLYELEHVWVHMDSGGDVTKVEASWHGELHDMRLGEEDGVVLRGHRPVLFVKPGKHAFAPSPAYFRPLRDEIVTACDRRSGFGGVWVTPLYAGRMSAKTPLADRLAHTYLEQKRFVPSFAFSVEDRGEEWAFVPWETLEPWIPERVAHWVEQLKSSFAPRQRRWLRIAHRGASDYRVENGAAALRMAAELGADMVEIDVRLSSDRIAVVFHDNTLERVTTGRGAVADHTLEQLRQLKLKDERTGEVTDDGVLTLDEVLALCREEKLGLYVDIKDPAAAPAIAEALRAHNWQRYTIVGSGNPDTLQRFRELSPDVATSWLVGWPTRPVSELLKVLERVGASYLHPCWERVSDRPDRLLSTGDVELLHAAGRGVVCWHEERAEVIAGLRELGVDGVCSNRPEMLI